MLTPEELENFFMPLDQAAYAYSARKGMHARLDLRKLVSSSPFIWKKKKNLPVTKKKKKLILSDFRLNPDINIYRSYTIISTLETLLDVPFELFYLDKTGKLVRIDAKMLTRHRSYARVFENALWLEAPDIREKLKQHGYPQEDYYVLDHFELSKIDGTCIYDAEKWLKSKYHHFFYHKFFKFDIDRIIYHLREDTDYLQGFKLDRVEVIGLTTDYHYDFEQKKQREAANALLARLPALQCLSVSGIRNIDFKGLPSRLKALFIDDDNDDDTRFLDKEGELDCRLNLANLPQQLEILNAEAWYFINLDALETQKQLKRLKLGARSMDYHVIHHLPPCIETLELSSINPPSSLSEYKHLGSVDLRNSMCPDDLSSCTALKSLSLSSIKGLRRLPSLPLSLQSLEVSDLDSLDEFPDLSSYEHLESISFVDCPLLIIPPEKLPPRLKGLKVMDLAKQKLDLSSCHCLENLSLGYYQVPESPASMHVKGMHIIKPGHLSKAPAPEHLDSKASQAKAQKKPNPILTSEPEIKITGVLPPLTMDTKTDNADIDVSIECLILDSKGQALPINTYRQEIRSQIGSSGGRITFYQEQDQAEPQTIRVPTSSASKEVKDKNLYTAKYLAPCTTLWTTLPTLGPYDQLLSLELGEKHQGSALSFELRYCPDTQSYQIRFKPPSSEKVKLIYTFAHFDKPQKKQKDAKQLPEIKAFQEPGALRALLSSRTFSQFKDFNSLRQKIQALEKQKNPQKSYDFCMRGLADYCRGFTLGKLDEATKDLDPSLRVLIHRKGCCRHIAATFVLMAQYLGVRARLVTNQIHAYAEVWNPAQGEWQTVDLGGGRTVSSLDSDVSFLSSFSFLRDASQSSFRSWIKSLIPTASSQIQLREGALKAESEAKAQKAQTEAKEEKEEKEEKQKTELQEDLKENPKPTEQDQAPKPKPEESKLPLGPEHKALEPPMQAEALLDNWQDYFSPETPSIKSTEQAIHYLVGQNKILLELTSSAQGQALYAQMLEQKALPPQSLFIQSPDELEELWSIFPIPQEGAALEALGEQAGPLQTLIQKGGVLLIDWSRFTPTQIAMYKSLMDTPPTLFKMPVSKDLRIINIVTPSTESCESFYSRAPHWKWPRELPLDEYPRTLARDVIKESKEAPSADAKSMTIDLYHQADHWKEVLLGQIEIKDQTVHFTPGILKQALEAKVSELILEDAPLEDPALQDWLFKLQVERCVWINGEKISLPPGFRILCRPAPSKMPEKPDGIKPLESPTDLSHNLNPKAVFYLNPQSYDALFRRTLIQDGRIVSAPGWLETSLNTPQLCIVQTAPLSPGEQRRLEESLDAWAKQREKKAKSPEAKESASFSPMGYCNLSHSALQEPSDLKELPSERVSGFFKNPDWLKEPGGYLLETQDVAHMSTLLENSDSLVLEMHEFTEASELLEKIEVKGEGPTRSFAIKTQAIAQALQAGKRVILRGQLSEEVYQALESLFGWPPHIQSSGQLEGTPVRGQLILITEPLGFQPSLAKARQRHFRVPEAELWKSYKSQYQKHYRGLHPRPAPKTSTALSESADRSFLASTASLFTGGLTDWLFTARAPEPQPEPEPMPEPWEANFEKIQAFYQAACQLTHGQIGTPPFPRLTYNRLLHWMNRLETLEAKEAEQDSDHPLKGLFHHDYHHNTEIYAQLNVMAKWFFGRETTPKRRAQKLQTYPPEDPDFFWRRLNTLNSAALKQMFTTQEALLSASAQPSKSYRSYLERLEGIAAESKEAAPKDSQAKVLHRMNRVLDEGPLVLLKGDLGSGKTHLAFRYAQVPGRKAFWGTAAIRAWLESNPQEGEVSVAIFDEANLSPHELSFLFPLIYAHQKSQKAGEEQNITLYFEDETFQINPSRFKVILTCNPESYEASNGSLQAYGQRVHSPILQEIPSVYVKSWNTQSILDRVLKPLCQEHKGYMQDPDNHARILEQLLQVYQGLQKLNILQELSIRDAQSLSLRWLKRLEQGEAPQTAALKACLSEWGHLSPPGSSADKAFQALLVKVGLGSQEEIQAAALSTSTPPELKTVMEGLKTRILLSPARESLLAWVYENLQLSDQDRKRETKDKAPLIKSGLSIEGPSGVGKSTLMREFFLEQGYKLRHVKADGSLEPLAEGENPKDPLQRGFIHFTLTGHLEQDEKTLSDAFEQGCIVILDEMNLDSASLEPVLNQFLTGKSLQGEKPAQAGFFLINCQNRVTMPGRKPVPPPLLNRLYRFDFPEDSDAELQALAAQALPEYPPETHRAIVQAHRLKQKQDPFANTRTFFRDLQKAKEGEKRKAEAKAAAEAQAKAKAEAEAAKAKAAAEVAEQKRMVRVLQAKTSPNTQTDSRQTQPITSAPSKDKKTKQSASFSKKWVILLSIFFSVALASLLLSFWTYPFLFFPSLSALGLLGIYLIVIIASKIFLSDHKAPLTKSSLKPNPRQSANLSSSTRIAEKVSVSQRRRPPLTPDGDLAKRRPK